MNKDKYEKVKNMPTEYKKLLVRYLFLCILSEGSKILCFSIAALMLKVFREFLFAMIWIILLRVNGGGLHFKHYASCFLMSLLVLFGSIVLGIYFPFSKLISCIIVIISMPIAYQCVPVVSAYRPPATEALIRKSKKNTVLVLTIYFFLICIVPMNRYLCIGVWNIMIHICQLFIAKSIGRRKRTC